MSGVGAVAELLPRIAALPARDDLESYKLPAEKQADVRRKLYEALFSAVSPAWLFPADLALTPAAALALLAQSDWSLSQAQRHADAVAAHGASGGAAAPVAAQPEYSSHRRGMACGHVFRKGEPIFRCHDCSYDDTCVQCAMCFQNSIHAREQHDIVFSVADENGACCDCGDEEAWKFDLRCEFHSMHPHTENDEVPEAEPTLESLYAGVPEDARTSITAFSDLLLTFYLQVITAAEPQRAPTLGPELVEELKRMPTLERLFDTKGKAEDAPQPFAALLWNDEKHTFTDVSDKIMDVMPSLNAHGARAFAEQVDKHGREILAIMPELRRLVIMARRINIQRLLVTVQPAFDYYVQEVAGVVLAFLMDLASCSLYTPHGVDGRACKVLITTLLLTPWENSEWAEAPTTIARELFDPSRVCKLDALLLLDTKMWKEARLDVRHLMMDLIACRQAKLEIAVHFAYVYPRMIETFILHDREPEHSIYHMTVQLFSVPSVAARLVVEHNFMHTLLQVLHALFVSDNESRVTALTLPSPPPARGQANANAPMLSQAKCYHVFHDTRYLLAAGDVKKNIAQHATAFLAPWLAFFAYFHGIAPDTRAAHAHVEFESELWYQVFHASSHLGRLAKILGEAFQHATSEQLSAGLQFAADTILAHLARLETLDSSTHPSSAMHTVRFPASDEGAAVPVAEFVVAQDPVSFHHPMHWLLAEMLKSVGAHPGLAPPISEDAMLALLEHPLRVTVKLAQIRCNVWVRNGFAIRSQAYHYRDSMWMRDIMYDQDLFVQQCALAFVSHDRFLVTLLDRFDLVAWFSGERGHALYDGEQATFMAEELLLLLVMILTEISVPAHWPIEQQVRRELIHYLVLGAGTYSEVTKQIPERFTDHGCFDRELARVASFRSPDGTHDLGMYELKPEFLGEVQPFFQHYTRNQRERAEEVLAERRAKTGDVPHAPRPALGALDGTLFARLGDVLLCPTLLQIVAGALGNATYGYAEPPDTLLNAALHLLYVGVAERGTAFVPLLTQALQVPQADHVATQSLVDLLAAMLAESRLSAYHEKIRGLFGAAAALDPALTSALPQPAVPQPAPSDDAKRQAAKERQAAIMQKFSDQQKSLLATLEDELGDDEDEMDETVDDYGTCILCQERLDGHRSFGTLVHIQESRLMRTTPPRQQSAFQEILGIPLDMDRSQSDGQRTRGHLHRYEQTDPHKPRIALGYAAENHTTGFVAVTCGHSMHVGCFNMYLQSTEQRHAMQVARSHPEDLSRLEFICPLCKSLGNTLLPEPGASAMSRSPFCEMPLGKVVPDDQALTEWVRRINIAILKNTSASASARAEHQEHDCGSGCFLPFYAPASATPHNPDLGTSVLGSEECAEMLQRARSVLQLLAYETSWARSRDRRQTILEYAGDAAQGDAIYIPEHVVGYTLAQLEITQRGVTPPGSNVAAALSEQQIKLVQSLLETLSSLAHVACKDAKGADGMRQGLLKRLMPHWAGEHSVRSPLLLRNALGVLVESAVLMPQHLLHATALLFYVTLVQTVFGLAQPSFAHGERRKAEESAVGGAEAVQIFPHARWLVTSIVNLVGYVRGNITLGFDHCSDQDLAKLLCAYTLPFLRRAALLHRIVSGVVPEPAEGPEYVRLLHQLRIPLPAEALPMHAAPAGLVAMLVEGWTKHAYVHLSPLFRPLPILAEPLEARTAVPSLVLEHPHIYELLPLPHDFALLLQQTQTRVCKRCNTLPPLCSLCLFCGEVLCEQSFCCSDLDDEGRGECHQHMEHCGGRLGAHFRVGSNVVVLLFQRNGCFTSSPYLNTHGEVDHSLLKARPQRLHTQRYDELRKQWLTHGIANIVTRRTEANVSNGGWITF